MITPITAVPVIPPRPDDYPKAKGKGKRCHDVAYAWCEMCHRYLDYDCFGTEKGKLKKLCNYHERRVRAACDETFGLTRASFKRFRLEDPVETERRRIENIAASNTAVAVSLAGYKRCEN